MKSKRKNIKLLKAFKNILGIKESWRVIYLILFFVYFIGSLGCWSHLDPVTARLRGLGHGLSTPTGQFSLKDVVYQDAGTYKCIGQSPTNKKKLEVLQTVGVTVKGEYQKYCFSRL